MQGYQLLKVKDKKKVYANRNQKGAGVTVVK